MRIKEPYWMHMLSLDSLTLQPSGYVFYYVLLSFIQKYKVFNSMIIFVTLVCPEYGALWTSSRTNFLNSPKFGMYIYL